MTPIHLQDMGSRVDTCLSLTWADVDFNRRVITVRAAYVKNGERRSIPMNDVLTATLKAVKMETLAGDAVFRTPHGRPCRNFRTAFEHAVQKAGLEDFTFHDLRHTFASRLVMAGVDLPTVKELLWHKSIAMTLRYKQHPESLSRNKEVEIELCSLSEGSQLTVFHLIFIGSCLYASVY